MVLFQIISQVSFVSIACNFTGWCVVKRQCISNNKKNVSVSEILEIRHETSQVAATQCEVCGGSVETPTHVVVLLEDRHIMKRHYIYDII